MIEGENLMFHILEKRTVIRVLIAASFTWRYIFIELVTLGQTKLSRKLLGHMPIWHSVHIHMRLRDLFRT